MDIPAPQIVEEQTVEVVKVTPRVRVQQRTVEFEHQSQLTLAFTQKDLEYETNEVHEKSAAVSQTKAGSDGAKRERALQQAEPRLHRKSSR